MTVATVSNRGESPDPKGSGLSQFVAGVAGVAGALSNPGCGGSAEPVRNRSAGGLTMGDIGWGSERTVGFQCVQSAVVHTGRQEDVVVDSGSSGDLFGWWGLCALYGVYRAMQWAE